MHIFMSLGINLKLKKKKKKTNLFFLKKKFWLVEIFFNNTNYSGNYLHVLWYSYYKHILIIFIDFPLVISLLDVGICIKQVFFGILTVYLHASRSQACGWKKQVYWQKWNFICWTTAAAANRKLQSKLFSGCPLQSPL